MVPEQHPFHSELHIPIFRLIFPSQFSPRQLRDIYHYYHGFLFSAVKDNTDYTHGIIFSDSGRARREKSILTCNFICIYNLNESPYLAISHFHKHINP